MEMAALRIQAGDSGGSARTGLWEWGGKVRIVSRKSHGLTHPPTACIIPQMCNLLEYFCDQELQHRMESHKQPLQSAMWTSSRPARGTAKAILHESLHHDCS